MGSGIQFYTDEQPFNCIKSLSRRSETALGSSTGRITTTSSHWSNDTGPIDAHDLLVRCLFFFCVKSPIFTWNWCFLYRDSCNEPNISRRQTFSKHYPSHLCSGSTYPMQSTSLLVSHIKSNAMQFHHCQWLNQIIPALWMMHFHNILGFHYVKFRYNES